MNFQLGNSVNLCYSEFIFLCIFMLFCNDRSPWPPALHSTEAIWLSKMKGISNERKMQPVARLVWIRGKCVNRSLRKDEIENHKDNVSPRERQQRGQTELPNAVISGIGAAWHSYVCVYIWISCIHSVCLHVWINAWICVLRRARWVCGPHLLCFDTEWHPPTLVCHHSPGHPKRVRHQHGYCKYTISIIIFEVTAMQWKYSTFRVWWSMSPQPGSAGKRRKTGEKNGSESVLWSWEQQIHVAAHEKACGNIK